MFQGFYYTRLVFQGSHVLSHHDIKQIVENWHIFLEFCLICLYLIVRLVSSSGHAGGY